MDRKPRCVALAALAVFSALPAACSLPRNIADLESQSPPPAHGRPGWVRGFAKVGSVLGAVVGGIASIGSLPLLWPIAQLSDEPLGMSKDEFLFAPAVLCAGGGHFLLGAPADLFDYSFRRAWVGTPRPTSYDFVPEPQPRHALLDVRMSPGAEGGQVPAGSASPGSVELVDGPTADGAK